ncbi:MAG: hypothetical protein ACPH9N_06440 [Alteromonas sp.]
MKLAKFFKRKYPYSPIAYLGRKNVERIFGARIMKLKKLDKLQAEQAASISLEHEHQKSA